MTRTIANNRHRSWRAAIARVLAVVLLLAAIVPAPAHEGSAAVSSVVSVVTLSGPEPSGDPSEQALFHHGAHCLCQMAVRTQSAAPAAPGAVLIGPYMMADAPPPSAPHLLPFKPPRV